MPYCPNCNRNKFEIEQAAVGEKQFHFVQCTQCKVAVGVIESESLGLSGILRVLVSSLQRLNSRLERMEQALGEQ